MLFYQRKDLRSLKPLNIKGYVTGVVMLLNDELAVSLDGMPMSRIRTNDDGTLTCKYFGPLESVGSISPYIESVSHKAPENAAAETGAAKYLFGGYSCFPLVRGAGVSREKQFFISLKKGNDSLRIVVRHQGSRAIFAAKNESGKQISFHYQGTSLPNNFAKDPELRSRLQAISAGIRSVEGKFGVDLVSRVNLVDYEKIRNAVTCGGEKEIWFYLKVLREEPLEELRTIAAHETLHLLVESQGFAEDAALREHFADLKGFDFLSYERFMLITKGIVLEKGKEDLKDEAIFFAFLDERNFLKGMKGGHAYQNPEEFCTSFLHSLMFVERLKDNLDRPLFLRGRQEPYFLSQTEKQNILKEYVKTLEILKQSLPGGQQAGFSVEKVGSILEQAHHRAKHEWKRREMTVGAGVRLSCADLPSF
ncbi:MAG: hypothetical protein QME75_11740 [Deltaproteobacteria bacterium]|nr:hypothetical protein [Deltaproteobacteria bacterium]